MSKPIYGCLEMSKSAPKTIFPHHSMHPSIAALMISDELALDGNPALNMASFVTTFMDKEAEALILAGMRKNFIDLDEYVQTAELANRCVEMLADLFHAPPVLGKQLHAGTGTIGSSEAIMLCVLAFKWNWRKKRRAAGLDASNPNIVCGSNVQCREADVSPDCLVLTAERAKPLIDENTIAVCAILGSTFNGEFENVFEIHEMVVLLNREHPDWHVPIHVDAASGGFIAPFISPDLVWDFRLPLVKSINVSGHKFGLCYAGVGWALWRQPQDLPPELVFHVNYLGGDQASFTLNFSKSASMIIGQYYNIIRLGREGYKCIMTNGMSNAAYLREKILELGIFEIADRAHMPLVAFFIKKDFEIGFSVFDIQDRMKQLGGWIIPAYACSKGAENLQIMRIVVKQNFSREMADLLLKHLELSIAGLKGLTGNISKDVMNEIAVESRKGINPYHSHSTMKVHQRHVPEEAAIVHPHQRSGSKGTRGIC